MSPWRGKLKECKISPPNYKIFQRRFYKQIYNYVDGILSKQ